VRDPALVTLERITEIVGAVSSEPRLSGSVAQ
jgi:hypothetical protein